MNENDSLFKSILERANIDVDQLIKAYDNQLSHYPTVQATMFSMDSILVLKQMNY